MNFVGDGEMYSLRGKLWVVPKQMFVDATLMEASSLQCYQVNDIASQ